jgi:type II secretory pathway component PulM
MKAMTARERKLVAIGLLVAAFALLYLGLIQPILGGFADREARREQLRVQFSQNERMIARIATLRRTAEAQRELLPLYSLRAPNSEQAAERLKERLGETLTKAGGQLSATNSVDAMPGWVRASGAGQMSHEQLVTWLGMLRNDQPYLAMESLTVVADRALNSGRPDLMDVTLETSIPFSQTNAR